MINLGRVRPGSTIYIPFETFASSTGAPITLTGLATSDIQVYKDGGTTQRASASGFTLLDTDGIDFDGITGIHGFSIDLSDNTTADFWASGSRYFVVVSTVTVDSQTMSFIAATFNIGYEGSWIDTYIATLASQTSFTLNAGPAEDDALNGHWAIIHDAASAVQSSRVLISDYTGASKTVTLAAGATFTAAAKDNISIMGMAPMQPATLGRQPVVDASGLVDANTVKVGPTGSGTAQTARDIGASVLLSSGTGTGQLDFTSGRVKADTVYWNAAAVSVPTNAGVPNVNAKTINDVATTSVTNVYAHVGTSAASTAQTGDSYARLGAPAGASVSADIATVDTVVDAVKVKTDYLPSATAGASGGLVIAGTNAPITFTGSGSPITLLSTGGNGSGLLIAGNGSGNGITVAGGATGHGVAVSGGANGDGVHIAGGGTSGDGINITATSGDGVDISGGGTSGHGVKLARGGASGDDMNFVNSDVTIPTVTTVTNAVSANVTQISGDSTAADNAESFFDGSGYGVHVARTTVSSVTSQTILMLNAGTISLAVANAYKGCMVIIRDHTDTKNVMFAVCTAYDESTGQLTINSTSGATFTIAASNIVEFVLPTFAEDDRTTLSSGTSAATIADAVWDEARSGHTTAGTFGKYLDAQVSSVSGGAGATVDATYVDAAHTWTFPSSVQTTATRIINELIGFNGIACMDFTNVIPSDVAISSVDSATFANISGTEPTVGTTSVSTNLKKVLIPVNATSATANTYTLSVTVTTTDSQQFIRKGQFTVA